MVGRGCAQACDPCESIHLRKMADGLRARPPAMPHSCGGGGASRPSSRAAVDAVGRARASPAMRSDRLDSAPSRDETPQPRGGASDTCRPRRKRAANIKEQAHRSFRSTRLPRPLPPPLAARRSSLVARASQAAGDRKRKGATSQVCASSDALARSQRRHSKHER